MKTIFAILLLCVSLFSTTLLTYNTYDREDRVDIMLSFDTPYNGKIFLKKEGNTFNIILNNVFFNKSITKNINSPILEQMEIVPQDKNIKIILTSKKKINIIASKTTDGFGLRLRAIQQKKIKKEKFLAKTNQNKISSILDKNLITADNNSYNYVRYYTVILILLILLLILWFTKKQINKAPSPKWLFGNDNKDSNEVKILYRKAIDPKNSVLLLSYQQRRYLVLTGSSNQLLDKFSSEDIPLESDKDEEFEKIFARNREKLDQFLKVSNNTLSTYRDKASLDIEDIKK